MLRRMGGTGATEAFSICTFWAGRNFQFLVGSKQSVNNSIVSAWIVSHSRARLTKHTYLKNQKI